MEEFFPAKAAGTAKVREQYSKLKDRTRIVLKEIISGADLKAQIEIIDNYLLSLHSPTMFWGPDGVEIKMIKQFEETCVLIGQHVAKPPKTMTVLEFFQTIYTIEKQIKTQNKK